MNTMSNYSFGAYTSKIRFESVFPSLEGYADRNLLFVCDPNTEAYARSLADKHRQTSIVVLKGGEQAKTWESVLHIVSVAQEAGFARDAVFIGVGGGVVCDLCAFAASVYMRGVGLVLMPTTLLAMVDAAIGGKTGFDLLGYKNLVGTFRPADEIVVHAGFLATLPPHEMLSGMAEVIKTALIGDEPMFELLKNMSLPISSDSYPDLIARCVHVKAGIVHRDPTETGEERALLNLGHTFGHALESVLGLGKISHGEAVAWGIAQAALLSRSLGQLSNDRCTAIRTVLQTFGYELAVPHPAISSDIQNLTRFSEALIDAMRSDKKKKDGSLRFILPTDQGCSIIRVDDLNMIRAVLQGSPS